MSTLISTDYERLEKTKKTITEQAARVNLFINTVESAIGEKLTDEQKEAAYRKGMHAVKEMLKGRYPYPDADEDFNLRALGINLKDAEECHRMYFGSWAKHKQALNSEGEFEVQDIENHPEVQYCYKYTQNKKQEEALKKAKKLSDLLNDLDNDGLLNPHSKHRISDVTSGLVKIEMKQGERKFRPHRDGIAILK